MHIIINEHLDLVLIKTGISPYISLGFHVRNHDEIKRNKPRLVTNYQEINKILEFDEYFIPSREHLISCMHNAKCFLNLIELTILPNSNERNQKIHSFL